MVLSSVAPACGGSGGQLGLADYFQRFAAANADAENRGNVLQTTLQSDLQNASDQRAALAYHDFLQQSLVVSNDFLDKVSSLDPPLEARSAHLEYVAAFHELAVAFQGAVDAVGRVKTRTEAEQVVLQRITPAAQEAGLACARLQQIANANSINVDLKCQ